MATAQQTLTARLDPARDATGRRLVNETSLRVQRLVGVFRLIAALALLIVGLVYDDPRIIGGQYPNLFTGTAIVYSVVAAVMLMAQQRARAAGLFTVPLELTADMIGVTILMHASGGISSGIGGLLVIFVGAASLSLRGQHAIFAAAIAAMAVLAEQMVSYAGGVTEASAFMPAGFLGAIIFAIALTASPLARRLQESEALARQRGIDLANLAQLNDYIIQNLRESIVVVDERDHIRLINQSAAEHLGVRSRAPGQPLRKASRRLHQVLTGWREAGIGFNTMASFLSANGSTNINTYIAPLEGTEDGPVLIFLEDANLLSQKAQQTKLAALGRLSASIAHEIRNPVGALSHAGQLLRESATTGDDERRLLDIIATNSARVSQIVENVLQLSRREETKPESIQLGEWLEEFRAEFRSTLELPADSIHVDSDEPLEVRMDPSHFRQICWNLCENAVRYGTPDGAGPDIGLRYGRMSGTRRPFLEVVDRGTGIAPEMQEHLFEPFATGRAGGTGLGLFIARELCQCNGANLVYEPAPDTGSIFRVVFADPQRWGTLL